MVDVDLNRYLKLLWRWLWLIVLTAGLAGAASFMVTRTVTPTYVSIATIMVGEETASPDVNQTDLALSQRATTSYTELLKRQPILDATVKALQLPGEWWNLRDRLLVTRVGDTQFIELRVEDTDPQRAKATADELIHQLIVQSPTSESLAQMEQQRQFLKGQLDQLQADIKAGEASIAEKKASLLKETSARGVLDLQDQIQADDLKLTTWRSTYATLLAAYNGKRSANAVTIIDPSFVPTTVSPNVRANVMLGAFVGALLAIMAILLIEYLGDALGDPREVRHKLGIGVLGMVSKTKTKKGSKPGLVTAMDPYSPTAEAYRVIRMNSQFASKSVKPALYAVTSAGLGEGKSTTSSNLAISFAQGGWRTILVDADLRHPTLHRIYGTGEGGLTSLFLGGPMSLGSRNNSIETVDVEQIRTKVTEVLYDTAIAGLQILPAGPSLAINPAELLSMPETRLLLQTLQEMADVVIVDSPPVLPVADAMVLGAQATGVILVIDARRTRAHDAKLAYEALRHAGAHVLGAVLNRAPVSSLSYRGYPPDPAAHEPNRDPSLPVTVGHTPVRSTRRPTSADRGRVET